MASNEKLKEVLTNHLKAYASGDWKTYKALLVDDAVYEEEATGRRITGAEQIVKAVEPWRTAFPDIQAQVKDVVGSGDALVAELLWTGTHKGPLMGPFGTLAPTGNAGKLPAVQVVRFDGDRIREIRHYFDLMTLLSQIGALPQMGAGS